MADFLVQPAGEIRHDRCQHSADLYRILHYFSRRGVSVLLAEEWLEKNEISQTKNDDSNITFS